jgi:hypothetical protein
MLGGPVARHETPHNFDFTARQVEGSTPLRGLVVNEDAVANQSIDMVAAVDCTTGFGVSVSHRDTDDLGLGTLFLIEVKTPPAVFAIDNAALGPATGRANGNALPHQIDVAITVSSIDAVGKGHNVTVSSRFHGSLNRWIGRRGISSDSQDVGLGSGRGQEKRKQPGK